MIKQQRLPYDFPRTWLRPDDSWKSHEYAPIFEVTDGPGIDNLHEGFRVGHQKRLEAVFSYRTPDFELGEASRRIGKLSFVVTELLETYGGTISFLTSLGHTVMGVTDIWVSEYEQDSINYGLGLIRKSA